MPWNNSKTSDTTEVSHIPTQGYFIRFGEMDVTPQLAHAFCGKHSTEGAVCPNCEKPLLRYLSFDVKDSRLDLGGFPLEKLDLFYCWTCNISQSPFFYLCQRDGSIKLLQYGEGGQSVDFPYPNYPRFFPQREIWLEAIAPETQRTIILLNQNRGAEVGDIPSGLDIPRHQVGGIPYLMQPVLDLRCPRCKARIPLFASLGDNTGGEQGFTGNEFVQVLFHLCPTCGIVGAYQQCD